MTFMGATPEGSLIAGSLAGNIGAPWTLFAGPFARYDPDVSKLPGHVGPDRGYDNNDQQKNHSIFPLPKDQTHDPKFCKNQPCTELARPLPVRISFYNHQGDSRGDREAKPRIQSLTGYGETMPSNEDAGYGNVDRAQPNVAASANE